MTTTTLERPAQLGFTWACAKTEAGEYGQDPVQCIARGTDSAEYVAHMRGHGLRQLHPALKPIKLRKTVPAATLRKTRVPVTADLITWTDHQYRQDGKPGEVAASAERTGQFWSDHACRGYIWVVPSEPAPWEEGPVRLVALMVNDDGTYSTGWIDPSSAPAEVPEDDDEAPATVAVYDVAKDATAEVTRSEAAAGVVRYARSLGAGTPACAEYERRAMDMASEPDSTGEGTHMDDTTEMTPVTARTEREAARADRRRMVQERSQAAQEPVTASGVPLAPSGTPGGSQGALQVRASAPLIRGREPLSGEKVLWWARGYLGRFIMWPSERALDAAVLWAAHAHARDADGMLVFSSSPRALFSSAEPGSGKSAAMRAVSRICPSPAVFTEPSEPAVAHAIGKEHATLFLDEADVLFQTQRKAAIRAIINDGYTPDGVWARVRNGSVDKIPTFGALAMAGLDKLDSGTGGTMNATLTRCIRWRMRRAPDDYRAPRIDAQARLVAGAVTDRLGAWAQQETGYLATAVPDVPEGIGNRAAELWEPLLAVADAAGGRWPQAARDACEEFVNAAGIPDDDSEREAVLEDIMTSWGIEGSDQA